MKRINKHKSGMVDVSEKKVTKREAIAVSQIKLKREAYDAVKNKMSPKGDVLETAKIAAIMAAKNTSKIIPMCHPICIENVTVSFRADDKKNIVETKVKVSSTGKTGVEMEALTAVSAAALTIYDMLKYLDKSMKITNIMLLEKRGGKSGDFKRKG